MPKGQKTSGIKKETMKKVKNARRSAPEKIIVLLPELYHLKKYLLFFELLYTKQTIQDSLPFPPSPQKIVCT